MAILVVTAPTLVPLVYGDAWGAAVAPTQILAVAGVAFAVSVGMSPLLLAAGQPKVILAANLAYMTVFGVAIYVACSAGIIAVAVAAVVTNVAFTFVTARFIVERRLGIPSAALLTETGRTLIAVLPILAIGFPAHAALVSLGAPGIVTVCSVVGLSLTAYAAFIKLRSPDLWRDLSDIAVRLRPHDRRQRP